MLFLRSLAIPEDHSKVVVSVQELMDKVSVLGLHERRGSVADKAHIT